MTSWSGKTSSPSKTDLVLAIATRTSAILSAAVVAVVITFLITEAAPAWRRIGIARFVTDDSWHPLSDQYNLIPMIAATLLTTTGAMLLAGPLGVASAVFNQFYAPYRIAGCYRRLVELLAGIPSVVFGLWGLVVLAPLVARLGGSGQSLLTATLVLGLMLLPTVSLTAHAALRAVPRDLIAGGAALGLGRWAITWRIALPAARRGIGIGLLLALSRAMGETMAVVMLAGNVAQMPRSVLSPVRTLTANMAWEMGYATSGHRSILFVSGLLLMLVVCAVVVLAECLGGRRDAF